LLFVGSQLFSSACGAEQLILDSSLFQKWKTFGDRI
jgi:hypothetical protein